MTRKSRREVERDLDDLAGSETETDHVLAFRTEEGDLVDSEDNPVDPDTVSIIIDRATVMRRERAESSDREILGPADTDAETDDDFVRVRRLNQGAGDG